MFHGIAIPASCFWWVFEDVFFLVFSFKYRLLCIIIYIYMFFQICFFAYFDTTHQHVRGNNKNLRTIKLLAVIMKGFQHPQIRFGKASKISFLKCQKVSLTKLQTLWNWLDIPNPSSRSVSVSQCHPLQPFRKARHSRNTRPWHSPPGWFLQRHCHFEWWTGRLSVNGS